MWKASNLTIRGKTGSHGCVGLAEDVQVLLTLCGSSVSTQRWRAGGGRRPICVETSIECVWFAPQRLLLRVMWIHQERGALRSYRGGNRTGQELWTLNTCTEISENKKRFFIIRKKCCSNLHMCMLELQRTVSSSERRHVLLILQI